MNRTQVLMIAMGITVVLGGAGISVFDLIAYTQRSAASAVGAATPTAVELDRLEQSLQQPERPQVREPVEREQAQRALEAAEANLRRDRAAAEQSRAAIKTLRTLLGDGCHPIHIGCRTVSPGVIRAVLQQKLAAYEGMAAELAAREQTVVKLRQTVDGLECRASMKNTPCLFQDSCATPANVDVGANWTDENGSDNCRCSGQPLSIRWR